jgi:signal transduction histidine kinase
VSEPLHLLELAEATKTRRRLYAHRLGVLALGVAAEIAVLVPFALLGRGPFVGSLGALPVGIACITGFFAGPAVGATVALSAWLVFFPFVVDWSPFGLVALVLWVVPAALLGIVTQRLTARERQLAVYEAERLYEEFRSDLTNQAHHEVRTPAAVIYGMADVLLRGEFDVSQEQQRKFLALIAASAQQLTDVPDQLEKLDRPAQFGRTAVITRAQRA